MQPTYYIKRQERKAYKNVTRGRRQQEEAYSILNDSHRRRRRAKERDRERK